MLKKRVIPCLLLQGESLVKTIQFQKGNYIGDPMNAVKIYNDCEVDELIILDIAATVNEKQPNFDLLSKIVDECFIPLTYGGGIKTIEDMSTIFQIGVEKVAINALIYENSSIVKDAVKKFGSQSIVASIDCKKNIFGHYDVYIRNGKKKIKYKLDSYLEYVQSLGVGEILINDIHRDGMMDGYNLELMEICKKQISTPLIGLGGAGCLEHLQNAFELGITALAAGSLFVYKSKYRGVLINYPNTEIEKMR